MAGWEAGNSEMQIRSCTVYGRVWHTVDRPGSLSECDNRFTVSSMTQASRDVAQDRYQVSLSSILTLPPSLPPSLTHSIPITDSRARSLSPSLSLSH